MKQITCEMCGSTDLIKQDGVFVCQSCGCKYSVEEARKLMIEGTVDVSGSTVKVDISANIEKYILNARRALEKEDWEEVEKYYNMVEQNVSDNIEAVFFSSYGKAMLSLTDSDYFKREQKFKVLNHSISVISDYFETTTEDKESVLRLIEKYINKMYGYNFVYQRQGVSVVGALSAVAGVTGTRAWCKELFDSVKNAFIIELKQILEKHDEAYVREILSDYLSSSAEGKKTVVLQTFPPKLYTEGSPVIILSGILSKFDISGKTFLKLKFKKIVSDELGLMTVKLSTLNSAGDISEETECVYDLTGVSRDGTIGDAITVPIPYGTNEVEIKEICVKYADGSTGEYCGKWGEIANQDEASVVLGDAELLKQYQIKFGYRAKYIHSEKYDLWLCSCGACNKNSEETCHTCGVSRADIQAFDTEQLKSERDSRIAEKKKEKQEKIARTKKIVAVTILTVCACIAIFLAMTKVIIPNYNYKYAVELLESGNIVDGYESLKAMNGYRDSSEKADEVFDKYILKKFNSSKPVEHIIFGSYEQDNNAANGKEAIEWRVLYKQDGKMLVISRYALDSQPYNKTFADVTWISCSLRTWLNGTFFNAAFSPAEQAMISSTTIAADKNPKYSTNAGYATIDKIFLLSIPEAEKYFTYEGTRKCAPTDYAIAQGALTNDAIKTASGEATCVWWLRSPGADLNCAAGVNRDGGVDYYGKLVYRDDVCVRPALWINLDS